jgi:hypothetical protein
VSAVETNIEDVSIHRQNSNSSRNSSNFYGTNNQLQIEKKPQANSNSFGQNIDMNEKMLEFLLSMHEEPNLSKKIIQRIKHLVAI